MSPALWITWYDLPEDGREAYLSWFHGSHLPRLVERPGYQWAAHYAAETRPIRNAKKDGASRRYPPPGAVPAGHRYVLIVGGDGLRTFADPTPRQLTAALPEADRRLLALRTGAASNIMIAQSSVDGPAAGAREPGGLPAPCIQLGSFVFDGDEDELLAWYSQWRMPSMKAIPGCVGVTKLVSVAGWAKHAILHEFVSAAARNEHFVDHERRLHPEKVEWSDRITGQVIHQPGSPNVAVRLWPPPRG